MTGTDSQFNVIQFMPVATFYSYLIAAGEKMYGHHRCFSVTNRSIMRLFHSIYSGEILPKKRELYQRYVYGVLNRCQSQLSRVGDKVKKNETGEAKQDAKFPVKAEVMKRAERESRVSKYTSDDDDLNDSKWRIELAWLSKALEPALQLCRWALPTGDGVGNTSSLSSRSLSEIIGSIQRSKVGLQDWSLSDLTVGLFLIYLHQASAETCEDVKGVQICSDSMVQNFIYHAELAKGAYKDNAANLARNSMLRESSVLKFVKNSSVMRPGYYIGIDTRKKLVILGIRGTHTVYDLITDVVTSSDEEVTFEGYSTHFGIAEAARWFLNHEMGTIRKCLEEHEGFRLRLVGHSLGGATASLLAIMLRKKSHEELGFSPDIVSAIGFATSPCVPKELAESCFDYVTTVVMQDDIIPKLSVASLIRLRNEIDQTDWMTVLEKEDWRSLIGLVTNAKQVVNSVQDLASKLADYAKFRSMTSSSDTRTGEEAAVTPSIPSIPKRTAKNSAIKKEGANTKVPELFVPGTVYYLKRNVETQNSSDNSKLREYFTLHRLPSGEHFQRILLSSNLISAHKCDSHYYALRDVLKGLPVVPDEGSF